MLLSLLFNEPATFIVWILAIIYAITVHEFSHALSAHVQGDRTAEDSGRLTLNPFSHMDPLGFVLLILAGFGWGKPVPFNPYALKNHRFGPALVSLAGPLANLLSAIIFAIVLRFVLYSTALTQDNLLFQFVVSLIQINVILMLFNLIPVPPLDGSKVLYSFLPASATNIVENLERYGPFILLAVILFASPILSPIFSFVYEFIIKVIVGA